MLNFGQNSNLSKLPFEKWVPIGYPYARSALEGPKEPAKRKDPTANFGLDRNNFGQNCPKGIRTRAYKRSRLIMGTPMGYPYAPRRGAL
jgi:hypothetical protein